jgi:hypothetical protein
MGTEASIASDLMLFAEEAGKESARNIRSSDWAFFNASITAETPAISLFFLGLCGLFLKSFTRQRKEKKDPL